MASELEHIALANRNHDALIYLLGAPDEHPEWVATVAFYKALQTVEAVFANTGRGHGHGHCKRLEILQDKRNGFGAFCKHYEAMLEASEVARYLGARSATTGYNSFASYMTMNDVKEDLLKKRLMNVEMHARGFLSAAAKVLIKSITAHFSPSANPASGSAS